MKRIIKITAKKFKEIQRNNIRNLLLSIATLKQLKLNVFQAVVVKSRKLSITSTVIIYQRESAKFIIFW